MYPAFLLEHLAKIVAWAGTPAGDGEITHAQVTVTDRIACRFETIPPHLLKIPLIGELERAAWLMTWTAAGIGSGMVVEVLDSRGSGPVVGSKYSLERVQYDPAGRFYTGICVEVSA